tara:strand:+ start:343 stop:555 length:213 start_codon:yes stop_codon:yes gene_type:complete
MTDQGAERMNKEWMYFIAGAGLIGAIMSATILIQGDNYSDKAECKLREMQKMPEVNEMTWDVTSAYCRRF